jgi:hypothetical protein
VSEISLPDTVTMVLDPCDWISPGTASLEDLRVSRAITDQQLRMLQYKY